MINLQFLRGLIGKKPILKDGQAYVDKTNHRLIIGDTSAMRGEFVLPNTNELQDVVQQISNVQTDVEYTQNTVGAMQNDITNTQQDVADIQTDYLKTAGGNTITAGRVIVADDDGKATASSVNTTELYYLKNVTSSVQSQLNTKIPDPSTKSNGQALIYNSTTKAWEAQDIPGGGNFNTVANATVSTTWTKDSSSGLFYQQISVTGETATDAPMAFPQWTASKASEQAAWNKLEPYVESGAGWVKFWSSEKTTTAVNVKLYYTV